MTGPRKPPPKRAPALSFRAFLEDPAFCGLDLSPVVGAIADASEGREIDLDEATCRAVFNCAPGQLPRVARRTVGVSAGGRGGKSSRLLAPKAVHAAYTVPLPDMRAGERGRSVLIAPDRDLADQDLDYARGYCESSEVLRRCLVPGPKTVVSIRRPWDGQIVDIKVGAANRGGKAARGRSMVFLGLDEAAFFFTDSSAAITDREIYRAGVLRVVEGGQIWIVSTPWIEDEGVLESFIKRDWGTHAQALVVARVSTYMLRPDFDPTGTIAADMRLEDPENAAREIDAIPLAAGTSTFFDPEAIRRSFEVKPFAGKRVGVGAGGDFGFTSDCTAAVLAARHEGELFDAFDAFERRPVRGEPLKPSEVVTGAGRFVLAGGGRSLAADGHYKETVKEHLDAVKVRFVAAPEGNEGKVSTYTAARKVMQEGRFRVSIGDPALRERLRAQLRSITKKPLPGGGIQISAPRRKAGPTGASGGHGDLVSGLVLALWSAGAGKVVASGGGGRLLRGGLTRPGHARSGGAVDPRTGRKATSRKEDHESRPADRSEKTDPKNDLTPS